MPYLQNGGEQAPLKGAALSFVSSCSSCRSGTGTEKLRVKSFCPPSNSSNREMRCDDNLTLWPQASSWGGGLKRVGPWLVLGSGCCPPTAAAAAVPGLQEPLHAAGKRERGAAQSGRIHHPVSSSAGSVRVPACSGSARLVRSGTGVEQTAPAVQSSGFRSGMRTTAGFPPARAQPGVGCSLSGNG